MINLRNIKHVAVEAAAILFCYKSLKNDSRINQLNSVVNIQCSDGNWNYDSYMHGMANGLIVAQAIMTGSEPKFLDAPDQWLCEKTKMNNVVETQEVNKDDQSK